MKKKLLCLIIMFSSFTNLFAIDLNDFESYLISRDRIKTSSELIRTYVIDDFFLLGLVLENNDESLIYLSNGEKLYTEVVCNSKDINASANKYLIKLENTDVLIGDFNFDENIDILRTFLNPPLGMGINGIKIENKIQRKSFLEIHFPGYKYIINNDTCEEKYYKGNNKRIKSEYYVSLRDFKFCIINNRRGILVNAIGNVIKETAFNYSMDISKNDKSNFVFFYWDKEKQEYVLDKTVTQEQINNAYCLEDYFAYNGLKFSKLDSKLTDEDLKELDKVQLRLMRNAVYARHGRTFKSEDLQSLWECYNWYEKNPNYSDDLLTEVDKYNIELIQKYEK